jgi:opacity protein-like surface antigen
LQYLPAFVLLAAAAGAAPASAQIVVADHGDQKLTVSGYIQPQYNRVDRSEDGARDMTLFRRMVLTLQGTTTHDWLGTFQFDLAPAAVGDHVVIKDANLQYLGLKSRGLTITIGNQKPPFSRSLLTSSSRRDLVERPFTGDRSLGSPGRALGVKIDGVNQTHTVLWSGEIASSLHEPAAGQIRIDGVTEAASGWNEGVLAAGRVEFQPRGEIPREQGNLRGGTWKYGIALAGYAWHNDGDSNLYTQDGVSTSPSHADAATVNGLEASAAFRGGGWSIDTEFERISAQAIDRGFSGGLYSEGRAGVTKASAEAGRMIVPRRLEVVAAYDVAEARTYERPWQRAAAGLSWYIAAHYVRIQLMHRISHDDRGVAGARLTTTFVQAQFAF